MDGSIFKQARIHGGFGKDCTRIIEGSNHTQISILKGSHQDLDTKTVG